MRELREILTKYVDNAFDVGELEAEVMSWHHKQIKHMSKAPVISEIIQTPVKDGTKVEFVAKSVAPEPEEFDDNDWNEFLEGPHK